VHTGPGWAAGGWEDNPDLTFPASVHVYDRMRRTDTQVASILRAISLPLRATEWHLDTDGVDPVVVAFVEDELNLHHGRHRPGGVVFGQHLRDVLLALAWGFACFETVYEIAPARTTGMSGQVAHLKALASRHPRTLSEIRVTPDGELEGVVQMPLGYDTAVKGVVTGGLGDVWIPRQRLAFYCLDREGGDWTGTSLLRAAFKDWYLKEQAVKFAGLAVERNSMGLPVVTYEDDGDRQNALDIATAARAGSTAGVALPRDRMSLTLLGVTGSTVDPLPLIAYHDRAMTRSALAMFLDLGHDNGARSLGDTFVDFFTASLRSIAMWVAETCTQEVIRPLVELNFGDEALFPALVCEEITAKQPATADAVKALVECGAVTVDAGLEDQLRKVYALPAVDRATAPMVDPGAPGAVPDSLARASALVDRIAALTSGTR